MRSPMTIFLYISLLLLTPTTTTAASVPRKPTALELLEQQILPLIQRSTNIKSSTLNQDTGEFCVKLGATVQVPWLGYIFSCKRTVRGVASKDMTSATELEGISVKVMDYWMDVMELTLSIGEFDNNEQPKILNGGISWKTYGGHAYEKIQPEDTYPDHTNTEL